MDTTAIDTLLSVVAGSVLTYVGQWFTDRRGRSREQERLKMEERIQRDFAWAETQQTSIIELQNTIQEIWHIVRQFATAISVDDKRRLHGTGDPLASRGLVLLSRLDDRELVVHVQNWITKIEVGLEKDLGKGASLSDADVEELRKQMRTIIERLGQALRSSAMILRTTEDTR